MNPVLLFFERENPVNLKTLISLVIALFVVSTSGAEARQHHHHYRHHMHHASATYDRGSIVPNPVGCPRTEFCGCGAAVRIFGSPIRELWLAANWFKFPRTAPAPGMAAVRRHHVFVLEAAVSANLWRVYDANSGGHRTRIHTRTLTGYVIVNPHGSA
jgi:hypothetical protein